MSDTENNKNVEENTAEEATKVQANETAEETAEVQTEETAGEATEENGTGQSEEEAVIERTEDEIDREDTKAAIEAVLFSMGEAVEKTALARALQLNVKTLEKLLDEMEQDYTAKGRGIRLVRLENAYQLATKNEYYDVLTKMINLPKKHSLTDALMETLSIIAYKQPVTRQEIEAIRGVSCSHAVNKLMEYNLVTEVGRLDAIGRPILFGTTEDFLRCFGVSGMDDLPIITPDKIEDFKKEAMEEANIKVET